MKLLFVENHAEFARIVVAKFLAAHEVGLVPSLADARRALATAAFDAVLVDYDLDDGKGADLVRELRQGGSRIPIIGVSARDDGNAALLAAGADTAVSKLRFGEVAAVLDCLFLSIDFYQGAYGPTLRLATGSASALLRLRDTFARLGVAATHEVAVRGLPWVRLAPSVADVALVLERSEKPLRLDLVVEDRTGVVSIRWHGRAEDWLERAELLDPLLEEICSGHQHIQGYDALVEVAFREEPRGWRRYPPPMPPGAHESIDHFVSRVLHTLLGRHGALQVFLFGPSGSPFWCARSPLISEDMGILQRALDLIEKLEADKPKPFIGHDAAGRFSVAALGGDSDLFVVCVNHGLDRAAAKARVALVRHDLLPNVASIRNGEMRVAAGYQSEGAP
ncbi:MAG: response regulator [Myxococcales bacterium]